MQILRSCSGNRHCLSIARTVSCDSDHSPCSFTHYCYPREACTRTSEYRLGVLHMSTVWNELLARRNRVQESVYGDHWHRSRDFQFSSRSPAWRATSSHSERRGSHARWQSISEFSRLRIFVSVKRLSVINVSASEGLRI